MSAAESNLFSISGMPEYLILAHFVLTIIFIIIFVVILVKLIRVESTTKRVNELMQSSHEVSSIIKEKILPDVVQLKEYKDFQKKFQFSQQEIFEKLVRQNFDTLNDRLDDLKNEVVTQQMARHKLNDILASKIKVDPNEPF